MKNTKIKRVAALMGAAVLAIAVIFGALFGIIGKQKNITAGAATNVTWNYSTQSSISATSTAENGVYGIYYTISNVTGNYVNLKFQANITSQFKLVYAVQYYTTEWNVLISKVELTNFKITCYISFPIIAGATYYVVQFQYSSSDMTRNITGTLSKEKTYQEGYDEGYGKGATEGTQDAYQNGYNAGETAGYQNGYREGHDIGYEKGYTAGKNEGYSEEDLETWYQDGRKDGYSEGRVDGEREGYTNGYNEGYSEGKALADNGSFMALMSAVVSAPVKVFTDTLNFEILGINISQLAIGLLSLCLLIAVFNTITGKGR